VSGEELMSGAVFIFAGRLANSGITAEHRHRASPPVLCLEGEIRQVLSNLIGNAIDAMRPQGGRLLLRSHHATQWKTGARGVVFTVADSGCGISANVIQRIFEPFFTTKEIGGTGLGLWISKDIVDRHHGALRVRSSQREGGCGTVFRLFLPL
jgi:signal transduction histidine kinase